MRRMATMLILAFILGPMLAGCSSKQEARQSAPKASATGEAARSEPYVASVLREPFHTPDCKWAKKIQTENLVGYASREDAMADGHRPCKICNP